MKNLWHVSFGLGLLAACGCGQQPAKEPSRSDTPVPSASTSDHHHGDAPHGGTLADWGGGAYHVEFTVDHDAKSASVYVLGDDAKTPAPVNVDMLLLTIEDPAFQVELRPNPQTGESGGAASRFTGTHNNLGIVREFAGTISGEVNGTPYAGDFKETAGDHGHSHAHSTPHDGVVAVLHNQSGENVGFVELKLHDDKGDLEAWLAKDREMSQPLDIPAGSEISVSFQDVPGKTAVLRVRNNEQNEDEDGKPNLRNGMTNYFIFPGDSGQDASWLMGSSFRSAVVLAFEADGTSYESDEFTLVPHTHADGNGHTH